MSIRVLRASLCGLAIALVPLRQSAAHEIVGNRFFPAGADPSARPAD
ncbi:hypothetical protein [Bradyrhizobium sp.]|jgi:hypothetical protein